MSIHYFIAFRNRLNKEKNFEMNLWLNSKI